MKRLMRRFLSSLILLAPVVAFADEAPPVGTQTRAWVQLQTGGKAAESGPVRGTPGEVADRVYQRYLDSFTQPIPERLERERVGGTAVK